MLFLLLSALWRNLLLLSHVGRSRLSGEVVDCRQDPAFRYWALGADCLGEQADPQFLDLPADLAGGFGGALSGGQGGERVAVGVLEAGRGRHLLGGPARGVRQPFHAGLGGAPGPGPRPPPPRSPCPPRPPAP